MDETQDQQNNNSKVPTQLLPHVFKKGQSGNPGGRPVGTVSMKTYAKNMIASMNDEERQEFMNGLPKIEIWKMAEGAPDNKTDLTTQGEKINTASPELIALAEEYEKKLKETLQ